MDVLVERIPNKPIDSNSFIIYSELNGSCIIIDPGTEDAEDIISFIRSKNLEPEYIFLTHEHFDHIWGVNILKDLFNPKLVASDICSTCIVDKKKNLSVFYDQIGFTTYSTDFSIEELNHFIKWNGTEIEFIKTPGHSDASVCILIGNNLFVGDTIIKNKKTIIKLPTGSKLKLIESLSILSRRFCSENPMIYPGHGELFQFAQIKNQKLI